MRLSGRLFGYYPLGEIIGIIKGETHKLKAETLDGCRRMVISMNPLVYILPVVPSKPIRRRRREDVAQFIHWVGTDPSAP